MTQQVTVIPLAALRPREDQPRQHFDAEALRELADSIRSQGIRTPLTVRRVNGQYDILGGARRYRAAGLAGLTEAPCIVHEDMSDAEARQIVLLDNLQREDFLPWEEGNGYAQIVEADGKTVAEVAKVVGKSPSFVRGRIDLAEKAGQALRQAYLEGLSLGALEVIANRLPREAVSAKACPRCKVVLAGGVDECTACGADCRQVIEFPATDLQAVAAKKAKGRPAWQVPDLVQQIAERYGLAQEPVQVTMGFDLEQVDEEVLAVKTALEKRLGEVCELQTWAAQKAEEIRAYSPQAREVCRAQVRATRAALEFIGGLLGQEDA